MDRPGTLHALVGTEGLHCAGRQAGAELLRVAHDAFAQSLEFTAFLSVVLILINAVVVTLMLRNVDTPGESEAEPDAEPTNGQRDDLVPAGARQ